MNSSLMKCDMQLSLYEPEDLKKELKVQFVGEEAVDQGGVKKEWLQLLCKEIFDPKYGMVKKHNSTKFFSNDCVFVGMFLWNEETRSYWFNSNSTDFEEFQLIGKVIEN